MDTKYVQTFKNMLAKTDSSLTVQHRVAGILFHYRNTPHCVTGKTPAELFLKRCPRTRLSLLKPSLQKKVEKTQCAAKFYRDGKNPVPRQFDMYQHVKVRQRRGGKREKWIPGTVVAIKGPNSYLVRVPGNNKRFVHADDLVSGYEIPTEQSEASPLEHFETPHVLVESKQDRSESSSVEVEPTVCSKDVESEMSDSQSVEHKSPVSTCTSMTRTKSGRVVKAPDRLDL